jgi:hypothetical protein
VQIADTGNRGDQSKRAVPFAGIADGIVVRTQHQARQPRNLAFVAAADISDRIEMRAHSCLNHPVQDKVGRRPMLPGEKNAREMLWRLGNRCQPVDAADDLVAERRVLVPCAGRIHLTHAFPMPKAAPIHKCFPAARYKFGASGHANPEITRTIRLVPA